MRDQDNRVQIQARAIKVLKDSIIAAEDGAALWCGRVLHGRDTVWRVHVLATAACGSATQPVHRRI
jgi:hypothetical protein